MTADDTDSWEARYRRSLAEEEDQLDQFADTLTGRTMRLRTAYGLGLLLIGAVIGAVALVTDDRRWARTAGVAALAFLGLIVASVAVSLVRGWRPGR